MRDYPPPESLRVGGMPSGDDDDDDEWRPPVVRGKDEDGQPVLIQLDRGGAFFSRPGAGLRTCQCGQQVLTGSKADAQHVRECEPVAPVTAPAAPVTPPASAPPPRLVGLAEAVRDGVIGTTLASARAARHRDKTFPAARDTTGTTHLVDPAELARWDQARHTEPGAPGDDPGTA